MGVVTFHISEDHKKDATKLYGPVGLINLMQSADLIHVLVDLLQVDRMRER